VLHELIGGDVVIPSTARGAWLEIEQQLRPYVARRARDANDVDDLLQDIYVRIQAGIGKLRDSERFGPWVYQVARSVLVDHARARARRPQPAGDVDVEAELPQPASDDEDGEAERALAKHMAVFVAALPSPYREAVTLTELEGMTQKDAADMLGISLSGMKSRVQRGRKQIQELLQACCEIALDAQGRVMAFDRRPDARVPENCCDDEIKDCKC
jgi:RNA polymerase sigma-70 factor, ECF subfamily